MTPIKFEGVNLTLAENQPEYQSLPVCMTTDGIVISCWKMSWRDRFVALITGRVWCLQHTFGSPLQPQIITVDMPSINGDPDSKWTNPDGSPERCDVPPKGWSCSRPLGHDGPCAARPHAHSNQQPYADGIDDCP